MDKTAFKRGLKGLMDDMASRATDPAQARADYVDVFGDLLWEAMTTRTVTGTVTTTGSATTQTGQLTNGRIQ